MKKILFGLLLFAAEMAYSQTDHTPSFVKDSIDDYVAKALEQWQIPGVAVCIIKDGKVVLRKGYGVKETGGNNNVDENTLFMIGSNTKAFTAIALAMLETEKKISLDDKVTKWIPQFKLNNGAAGEQAIIKDLLCHRLGFQTFQGDFTYWTSNLSRAKVIEKMSLIKAEYPFRTKWGYTNAGFVVAGEIIPKATGMQWEDYITKKIFAPLGMNNSLALSNDFPNAINKSSAHTIANGQLIKIPFCEIDNLSAAGSIGSSANDMSHWVACLLNKGKYNDLQEIPAAAISQTWIPQSILGNGRYLYNTGHFSLYGLGWMLEEYCGKKIVSHTGGVNGFVTSVTLLPEDKLGIIVLTNTDQNSFYEALKWEITDAYLDKPYRNYSNVYFNFYAQQKKQDSITHIKMTDSVALHISPTLLLKEYAGNYFNEVYGNMSVTHEANGLKMNFSHHPNMYAKLAPLGGNRFYAHFSDPIFGTALFPFTVVGGKVTGVTVKVADFIEYNPYEFKKIK